MNGLGETTVVLVQPWDNTAVLANVDNRWNKPASSHQHVEARLRLHRGEKMLAGAVQLSAYLKEQMLVAGCFGDAKFAGDLEKLLKTQLIKVIVTDHYLYLHTDKHLNKRVAE